jgi:transposase
MTLHPQAIGPVPEETARVARAACPKGNPYLALRDLLGPRSEDQQFAALFPPHGQPAFAPWRLALVPMMQFAEGLSDRQAAEAVRGRLDGKYALNLELADPGFDCSVLCAFRARRVTRGAEQLLFETILRRCLATAQRVGSSKRGDSNARIARIRPMSWAGPRRHPDAQPLGMRGRDDAPGFGDAGRGGTKLAASTGPPRMEGAVCAAHPGVAPASQ